MSKTKARPQAKPTTAATDDLIARDSAERPAPSADKLEAISTAAGQLLDLHAQQQVLEDKGALLAGEVLRLTQTVLPALMDEAGVPKLTLEDLGIDLARVDEVYASISKADANAAADWLVANGYGSIVKTAFTIPVDKGDLKLQAKIRSLLVKARIGFEELASVHSGTLRAFAKESVEQGRKLPAAIKVHIQPTVKVGKKKAR